MGFCGTRLWDFQPAVQQEVGLYCIMEMALPPGESLLQEPEGSQGIVRQILRADIDFAVRACIAYCVVLPA